MNGMKKQINLHVLRMPIRDALRQISQYVLRTSLYDAQRQISSLQMRLKDAQAENERLHERMQGMCTVCIDRSVMCDCMRGCKVCVMCALIGV